MFNKLRKLGQLADMVDDPEKAAAAKREYDYRRHQAKAYSEMERRLQDEVERLRSEMRKMQLELDEVRAMLGLEIK